MSDVSGIPNMGFGGGNFFAPQFSYNPQINPTAGYAGPLAYNQNVVNNLYTGGGFGKQTADYAYAGAAYDRMVPRSEDNPFQFGGVPASLAYPGASLSGGYTTGAANMPSYDTGPNFGFTSGGAGAIDLSGGGGRGLFSGDAGGFSGGGGGSGGFSGGFSGGIYGGDSFGSGGSSPTSSGGGLDWSHIFGGGGGARADPAPGMSMPGGLGSPMTAPQQQPAAAGGSAPYTSGIEPDLTGGQTFAGSAAPPLEWPRGSAKAQDQPAFDYSGGSVGGTNAPTMPDSQKLLGYDPNKGPAEFDWSNFQSPANRYDTFQAPGGGGGDTDLSSSNKSAAQLAEDARARLAGLIGSPETAKAVEEATKGGGTAIPEPPAEQVPLPRERPAGADAPRPPADIPPQDLVPLAGRNMKFELAGVDPRFAKALQEFTRDYNASQDDYSMALRSGKGARDKGFHATGNAIDVNLIDRRNGERLTDYQTRDPVVFKAYQDNANAFHAFLEKNYPDLAQAHRWGGYFSGDTSVYGAQDIMHHDLGGRYGRGMAGGSWAGGLGQQEADTWGLPYGGGTKTPLPQFNFDWSNAPIPDVGPMPLTYKSPGGGSVYQLDPTTGQRYSPPMGGKDKMGELPGRDFVPAAPIDGIRERSGLNEGEPIPRPPADIRAAPVSRFFGDDEEIANRQVMPGDLTSKWNELIYEGVNKPTMARSESLGADPNPFKDFRQAEIDDRRNDPALTDEQRQTLSKLVPRGSYLPEPGAKIPEGGKLGEALGTQQLGNLEANATMRGTTQGARLPRAVGDPFEGDVSDGGFNFLDAAADGTSTQQGPTMPPWQTAIPQDKRDPGTIAAIEEGARRTGLAPEAIAAVITEESNWDPRNATGQFRGLTQMQEQTFKEAPGGRINGLTWDQYKNASGADQVKAYIDWLYQHNSLDRAANLGIDIRGKDPAEQAAWLQAFQFSPYGGLPEVKIPWVQEAFKGNYGMPVTNQPQAKDLGDWTLNAMRHRFGEEMMKNWPDTGRLPGGQ